MNIDSINNGIVIDHITAGSGMELYGLLGLDKLDCSVALIRNVASRKMGKKDIIKIDADIPVNFDVIGYVDPGITVNIIKGGTLVEKRSIELPATLTKGKKSGRICFTITPAIAQNSPSIHIFILNDILGFKAQRCSLPSQKAR